MPFSGPPPAKVRTKKTSFAGWFAVFALFVQALAPLSAAWASEEQPGGTLQLICTANGLVTLSFDQDGAPIAPVDRSSFCPLCIVHAPSALATPEFSNGIPAVQQAEPVYVQSKLHISSSTWRSCLRPSRAPPAFA